MKSPDNDIQLGEDARYQRGQFMSLILNKTLTHTYSPHKNTIPMWVHRIFETLFGGPYVPIFQGRFDYQYSVRVFENVPINKSKRRNTFLINGLAVDRHSEQWNLHPYLLTIVKVEPSSWQEFFETVKSCKVPELENDHHDRVQSQLGRMNEVTQMLSEVEAVLKERGTVEELHRSRIGTEENAKSLKNTRDEIRQTKKEVKEVSRIISLMKTIAENDPQGACQFQHFWDTGKLEQVDRSLDKVVSRTLGAFDQARDEEIKLSKQVATSGLALAKEEDRYKRGKADLAFKTAILNLRMGYQPTVELPVYVKKFVKSCPLPYLPYEPSLLHLLAWNKSRKRQCRVSVVLQMVTIRSDATELQRHLLANIMSQFSHTVLVWETRDEKTMKRRLEQLKDPGVVKVVAVQSLVSVKKEESPVPLKNSILSLLNVEDEFVWAFFKSKHFDEIKVHPETWSLSTIVDIVGPTFVCSENSRFRAVTRTPTSDDFQNAATLDCTLLDHLLLSDDEVINGKRCVQLWRQKLDLEWAHLTHLEKRLNDLNKDHTNHKAEHTMVKRAVPELAIKADVLEKVSRDFRTTSIDNHREIEEREELLKERLVELQKIKGHHKRQRKWLRSQKDRLLQQKSEFKPDAQYDELSKNDLQAVMEEMEKDQRSLEGWKRRNESGEMFRDTVCDFLARKNVSVNPEIQLKQGLARKAMVEVLRAMKSSVVFVDNDFPEIEGKQIMVVEG